MANSKGTILVIDDKAEFRRIYGDRLRADGYNVLEAENGSVGLEQLQNNEVNLVLLDVVMPELDGYGVLEKMSTDDKLKSVPVIILSALGDPAEVQKGLGAGASDYLIKGMYSPNDILSKVGALLARSNVGKFAQKYKVAVNPTKGDAVKLAKDSGFTTFPQCEKCNKERMLELVPQVTHDGWFDAQFVCDCD